MPWHTYRFPGGPHAMRPFESEVCPKAQEAPISLGGLNIGRQIPWRRTGRIRWASRLYIPYTRARPFHVWETLMWRRPIWIGIWQETANSWWDGGIPASVEFNTHGECQSKGRWSIVWCRNQHVTCAFPFGGAYELWNGLDPHCFEFICNLPQCINFGTQFNPKHWHKRHQGPRDDYLPSCTAVIILSWMKPSLCRSMRNIMPSGKSEGFILDVNAARCMRFHGKWQN